MNPIFKTNACVFVVWMPECQIFITSFTYIHVNLYVYVTWICIHDTRICIVSYVVNTDSRRMHRDLREHMWMRLWIFDIQAFRQKYASICFEYRIQFYLGRILNRFKKYQEYVSHPWKQHIWYIAKTDQNWFLTIRRVCV